MTLRMIHLCKLFTKCIFNVLTMNIHSNNNVSTLPARPRSVPVVDPPALPSQSVPGPDLAPSTASLVTMVDDV